MDTSTEISLKGEIKRQGFFKREALAAEDFNQTQLVNTWKLLLENRFYEQLDIMVWTYINNAPFKIYKKMNSKVFGQFTTIKDYTNKKGVTFPAHYTIHNHYIGPVSKLGNRPVPYDGNFAINREQFTLHIDRIAKLTIFEGSYDLSKLFEPVSIVDDDDDDDIPISQLVKKFTKLQKPKKYADLEILD